MPVIAPQGDKALVSQFKVYNIIKDEFVVSTRLATMQTIRKINAVAVGPLLEIPGGDLSDDGLTTKNYRPPA